MNTLTTLSWLSQNAIMWFVVLIVVAIAALVVRSSYEERPQDHKIQVLKHVYKTLLQVEYAQQQGATLNELLSYLQEKREVAVHRKWLAEDLGLSEGYERAFDAIKSYLLDGKKSFLKEIPIYLKFEPPLYISDGEGYKKRFNLLDIKTGNLSKEDFLREYSIPVIYGMEDGKMPKGFFTAMHKLDPEGDPVTVIYIPRIRLGDYFTSKDLGWSDQY